MITVFHANGKAEISDSINHHRPFDWGTEGGELYSRHMATDAWAGWKRPYTISADGKTVYFSHLKMFDFVCRTMKRQ
jgi:hypothetical protein